MFGKRKTKKLLFEQYWENKEKWFKKFLMLKVFISIVHLLNSPTDLILLRRFTTFYLSIHSATLSEQF